MATKKFFATLLLVFCAFTANAQSTTTKTSKVNEVLGKFNRIEQTLNPDGKKVIAVKYEKGVALCLGDTIIVSPIREANCLVKKGKELIPCIAQDTDHCMVWQDLTGYVVYVKDYMTAYMEGWNGGYMTMIPK